MSDEKKTPEVNQPENRPLENQSPEKKGYSKKARVLAWIGVIFMVFLVIMYSYSFASGSIMRI